MVNLYKVVIKARGKQKGGVVLFNKILNKLQVFMITAFVLLATALPAYAEGTDPIDWSTTFAPIQSTVLNAILAAIGIGVVIFGAIFGIRKLISVLKGVAK